MMNIRDTRSSKRILLLVATLPVMLACSLFQEGMAMFQGYESFDEQQYEECLEELRNADYIDPDLPIYEICSERTGYNPSSDNIDVADPPADVEIQSTLLIQSINTSKSDCEILDGLIGGTLEYCVLSVEIIIKYGTSVVPATVECIKNMFDEQFTKEESVDETSGTVTFSFSTTEKWSEIDPGRLDPGTFCYLRMDDGTSLIVTNEERYSEMPIDEPAIP